jgi:hypothetical protein
VKGAEVLLVTPSADFFAEPHVESLIGYGKVFHAAGISWTLSRKASEAGNFGMFIGNYEQMRKISMRVREAALELGVKRIVVGECGHAWRVAYSFWNTLIGPFDYLDPRYPVPQHICELTDDLIQQGALKFDREKNDDRIVTFHDSCNVARASRMGNTPGGQFVIPRRIITSVANNFHDMDRRHTMAHIVVHRSRHWRHARRLRNARSCPTNIASPWSARWTTSSSCRPTPGSRWAGASATTSCCRSAPLLQRKGIDFIAKRCHHHRRR